MHAPTTERAADFWTDRQHAQFNDAMAEDIDALAERLAKKILPHELYDLLDERPSVERELFELLAKNDSDANLKAIGALLWNQFAVLVQREIDNENDRLTREARARRGVRLWDES
ncbi:hypothetical protein [Burkholderia plantarii]|uniref:hypothetical protein n=1 Tax=Burkholderia plantarii TaxID=41899 RepID=UPI00087096DB|nr:hypothetical protein [Burkholderia plantarii]